MTIQEETLAVVSGADNSASDRSYVDWPAIFAGTVLATAISFILLTFGSALGLSFTSAYEGEGMSLFWFAIAAALWLLWVQVSSFFAGGYLAGRMRRRHGDATEEESDARDGAHGLVVWALGTLVAAFIAYTGVASVATVADRAGQAIGTVAGAAAGGAAQAADPSALLVDRSLRGGNEPANDATRGEFTRILLSATDEDGISQADRDYMVNTVAQRAGIPPEEARQRVDQLTQQAQQLAQTARDAAERARKVAMLAAFMTAASFLVAAAGAYWAATVGGNHRDKNTNLVGWYRRW